MKEFKEYSGPFIHSKETYKKIMFSYIIVFLPFIIYTLYINGLSKYNETKEITTILKPLIFILLPTITVFILEILYKLIFIKNKSLKDYIKQNFSIFGIIYFPLLLNIETPIYILLISTILGYILYKLLFKKWYSLTILSYVSYLILTFILSKFNISTYIEILNIKNINYNYLITSNGGYINLLLKGSALMCPLLSILSFIYLYIKKDIKYQITISAFITILLSTLIISIMNKCLWFPFYFILTGGTLFIITILTNDFYSPATKGGQIIYGVFIGVTIILLRFLSSYNIAPFSIFIAQTFTFAFDYINEFINKKIIYIILLIIVLITSLTIGIII